MSGLDKVKAVYENEALVKINALVYGQYLHLGGLSCSMELAEKASITPGMCGIDLGCSTGECMRFLVREYGVKKVVGVELTSAAVSNGRRMCAEEGFTEEQISFIQVCN